MATITQQKARAAFTLSGNSPNIIYVREGISQSFKKGGLLYLNASGACKTATLTQTVTGVDNLKKRILGLAAADAVNSTAPTNDVPVFEANADTVFIANLLGPAAATSTLKVADMGAAMTCSGVLASRVYAQRPGSAGGSIIRCLGLVDAVGDQYGRVLFQFLRANRIAG